MPNPLRIVNLPILVSALALALCLTAGLNA